MIRQACLAAGLWALVGCFSERPTAPESPGSGGPGITIANLAFVPSNLSVRTGTTVTWTNTDNLSHTISADDGHTFDSSAFTQGMTFQLTAGPPGTYGYFCRIHPFMRGTLVVTP
jgi:plastocyanin